ncbi:hypothetical protein FRC04_012238 [Tulasnella sp. 424]|nr:hypothetical protein FRC04_012238 [Tulasnella sp. 424]
MISISIAAIRSSPAPTNTESLQPSQTLYVDPVHWKSRKQVSFTLTDPIDGEQYPAQFTTVDSNSNGHGGYGHVWKCRIDVQSAEKLSSSFVAVKSLVYLYENLPPIGETIKKSRARKELKIWRRLRHPYIAPLLGNFYSSTPCFITIWYECGTLFKFIRPKVIDRDRIRILKELSEGLQYLHSNKVIHGDIHNKNVLARQEAGSIHPVFIDFGFSKMVEDSYNQTVITTSIRQKGRMIYMAPELLRYHSPPRHKPSDVYAFALLLLEVASGEEAFSSENIPQESIAAGSVKPDKSRFTFIGTPFWNLLSECWATESTSRPSIDDIAGRLGAMHGLDCYQRVE